MYLQQTIEIAQQQTIEITIARGQNFPQIVDTVKHGNSVLSNTEC